MQLLRTAPVQATEGEIVLARQEWGAYTDPGVLSRAPALDSTIARPGASGSAAGERWAVMSAVTRSARQQI